MPDQTLFVRVTCPRCAEIRATYPEVWRAANPTCSECIGGFRYVPLEPANCPGHEWVMPAEEWRTDSWDGPRCWYPPRHGTNDDELTDADVHCRLCGASPEAKDASDE